MLSRVTRRATTQVCGVCVRTVYVKKEWSENWTFKPNRQPSEYALGRQRSNAEELIAKVPVIEVKARKAICDGGSGALGHPVEYIDLHTGTDEPQVCKYCGLRYIMSKEKFHDHH